MKNNIIKILKIAIPLGIGVYLTWFFYNGLSEKEKTAIPEAFANANYFWVILSLVIAWLSHFSRAYRWKYMLEPLGYKPKVSSLYHSVMIGYIINLTIPRSGEFARAGFLAKKENVPFEKSFGTIVAERVIDVIMLLGVFFITSLLVGPEVISDLTKPKFENEITITQEFIEATSFQSNDSTSNSKYFFLVNQDINELKKGAKITHINEIKVTSEVDLSNKLSQKVIVKGEPVKKSNLLIYLIIGGLFLLGILAIIALKKLRTIVIEKLKGLWQGVKSIFMLKKRVYFLLHTLFIWICYIAMFWVCAQGVEGVESMDLNTTLVCFVVGGVAIAATPGGIGLYPLLVTGALVYYGYDKGIASGFSILMWVVQTVFLVVFGLISLYAINVKFSASEIESKNLE